MPSYPLVYPLHRARWLTGVGRPASPPHRASAVPWPCAKPIDRFSVPRPCSWTKPDPEPWPGTRLRVTPAERRRGALLRRCSAAAPRALCSWAVRSRSDGPKQTSPESKEPRKRSAPSFLQKSPCCLSKSTRSSSQVKTNYPEAQFLAVRPLGFPRFEPAVHPWLFHVLAPGPFQ